MKLLYNNKTGCFSICEKNNKTENKNDNPIMDEILGDAETKSINFGAINGQEWVDRDNNSNNYCADGTGNLFFGSNISGNPCGREAYLNNGDTFSNLSENTLIQKTEYDTVRIYCSGIIYTPSVKSNISRQTIFNFLSGDINMLHTISDNNSDYVENIAISNFDNQSNPLSISTYTLIQSLLYSYNDLTITTNKINNVAVLNNGSMITFMKHNTDPNPVSIGSDNLSITQMSENLRIRLSTKMEGKIYVNITNLDSITKSSIDVLVNPSAYGSDLDIYFSQDNGYTSTANFAYQSPILIQNLNNKTFQGVTLKYQPN